MTARREIFESGRLQIHASASDPFKPTQESRREKQDHNRDLRLGRRKVRRRRMWAVFLGLVCLVSLLALLNSAESPEPVVGRVESPSISSQPVLPVMGEDLISRLSELASVYPGEYGVAVYDARSGRTVEINADRPVEAASLAKLPVLLTLYKEAAGGDVDLDEEIRIRSSDRQDYGTGVLQDYPVGYEITLRECARLMIKESDNTAWVMLERRLGKDEISRELEDLGADGSNYATRQTTPEDVMLTLRAISDPSYTNPRLSLEMLDTMTDTAYETRIPEPLPENARVAHKVGALEETYSDAGVVFSGGTRDASDSYFIVVIAHGTTERVAEDAIQSMSLATYRALRSGVPE